MESELETFRVVICSTLRREAEAALAAEGLTGAEVATYPCDCHLGRQEHRISDELLGRLSHSGDRFLVLACSLRAVPDRFSSGGVPNVKVINVASGFELLLPAPAVRHFQSQGAYLITPGWLENWKGRLSAWGFDRETGRQFFAESCKQFLLLDTGVRSDCGRELDELATYLDRPGEILPVGTGLLGTILARYAAAPAAYRQPGHAGLCSADSAVVFDMMSRLSALDSEEKVIQSVFDLFEMFFAPQFQLYLPVHGDRTGNPMAFPEGHAVPDALLGSLGGLHESHAWTASGTGFMLQIQRDRQQLGSVMVEGIMLPEHRNDYLNLTMTILPVIALAIVNARSMEQERKRTAELESANRELDAFAYAVSHDLRAPLRAMNGFSQALAEDFSGVLHGEALTYLEQIVLASRKMGELIDGLLTLSRSTRGELNRDVVDLSEAAGQIRDELTRQEPQRQVVWQIEPGMVVRGDGRMLTAVMRNLIGNAWKYSTGTASPLIRVYSEVTNGERGYCVADNGAGFDMGHADLLFKPFQRLHRQDEFPGIGIGLATVQRIIHRHGGDISASGEPGKGAFFRFTLADSAVSAP